MKKIIIILVALVLVAAVAVVGIGVFTANTPERALKDIAMDVKESGLEGLEPHLTDSAKTALDTITAVTDNKIVGAIVDIFADGDYITMLKEGIKDIDWGTPDILKGDGKATVTLPFDYQGKIKGTVEIDMTKVEKEWKISNISLPKLDDINF